MSFDLFGDFTFNAGHDPAPDPYQNNQLCINYYPEVNKQNPKEAISLLACPGLLQLVAAAGGGAPGFSSTMTAWPQPSAVTNLPMRGMLVLPGQQQAIAVIGNTCYLVTASAPTATSFPTLTLTSVGTLVSDSGPVCIRDNGAGGVVCIVDGPNGYYYVFNGAGATIGPTGFFQKINDPNFLGATRVAFIDGWWIFNEPGTQRFYLPTSTYSTTFSGSNFALIDAQTDNLVTLMDNKEELWLVGEVHTEIWYDGGGQYFPFLRLVGTPLQVGCKAAQSIARFNSQGQDGLMWFGRSDRGENVLIQTQGLNAITISTPAFGDEVATYPITSDAVAYTYQEDSHEFYVLTFPTADTTWVYDAQSGMLHKRLSYDPYAAQFHRHRSSCFMNFQGMRIVGDYQNGALYWLTRTVQNDAGWPLLGKRRSPHIWDKAARQRVFMSSLQIDINPGVGQPSGLGSDPVMTLTISRDGGRTFGNRFPAKIGKTGQFKNRTMWRKLAFARDNVVDVEVIDPVPRDIVGATLKAFGEA